MIKVRALKNIYGNYGMCDKGRVIELNSITAKELIKAGLAEEVIETPEAPVEADVKEKVIIPPSGPTIKVIDQTGQEKKYNTKK